MSVLKNSAIPCGLLLAYHIRTASMPKSFFSFAFTQSRVTVYNAYTIAHSTAIKTGEVAFAFFLYYLQRAAALKIAIDLLSSKRCTFPNFIVALCTAPHLTYWIIQAAEVNSYSRCNYTPGQHLLSQRYHDRWRSSSGFFLRAPKLCSLASPAALPSPERSLRTLGRKCSKCS